MRKTARIVSCLILMLPGAFWLACSQTPAEDSGGEIMIGIITPLSGTFIGSGQPTVEGASLAVEEINRAGGIAVADRRIKIRLLVEDDESRDEMAVSKAVKLIDGHGAVALVGLTLSSTAIAVAKVADERHVPMITTQATHPDATRGREYAFRLMFTDDFQGRVLGELAIHDLEARRAAVLADAGSIYSMGLAETFRRTFDGEGRTTTFETFTIDEGFFDQLVRIRESRAEALLLPVYSTHAMDLIHQARAVGVEATLLGADAWSVLNFDDDPERGVAFFTDVWTPSFPSERSKGFVERFRTTYGTEPSSISALAYDAFFLIAGAIASEEEATPEAIRRGLRSQGEFEGVTGSIRFGATGDPERSVVVVRVETDGSHRFHKEMAPVDVHAVAHP